MTNVTFSISPVVLQRAREKAMAERRTLNELFRGWVEGYVRGNKPAHDFRSVMLQLQHVNSGKKWSRNELNER